MTDRVFLITYRNNGQVSVMDIGAGNVIEAIQNSGVHPDDIISVAQIAFL